VVFVVFVVFVFKCRGSPWRRSLGELGVLAVHKERTCGRDAYEALFAYMSAPMSRPFLKMNGLGNDFVVVEARSAPFAPTADEVRAIADRKAGVGCDQLIVIEPGEGVDARVRFWNADGGEIGACGNGTRCVGWLLMQSSGKDHAVMESRAGLLVASRAGERLVSVDMGRPRLDWREIPLAREQDTRALDVVLYEDPALATAPACVSMGNPHVVFFTPDIEAAPIATAGPIVEHHPLFPEQVNVGFAQVIDPARIRLRVWERGVGLTQACGTGACAALVAAARRGLTERSAVLALDGGDLLIDWRAEDDHVVMTGPAAVDFAGELP
jgi:diaminopimelate epimerase